MTADEERGGMIVGMVGGRSAGGSSGWAASGAALAAAVRAVGGLGRRTISRTAPRRAKEPDLLRVTLRERG